MQHSVLTSYVYNDDLYGDFTPFASLTENNETSYYSYEEEDPTDFYTLKESRYSQKTKVITVPLDIYYNLLSISFPLIYQQEEQSTKHSICEPSYDQKATIYNITVQVIIGFFVPYIAIVVSYLAIARMISKRARNRLQTDEHLFQNTTENYTSKSDITTRMSGFFRTLTLKSHNENHTLTLEKKKEHVINSKNNDNRMSMFIPISVKEGQDPKDSANLLTMNRLSVKKRPISNGSASSGESFLTDQTSVQVSPNMRLSQHLFNYSTTERVNFVMFVSKIHFISIKYIFLIHRYPEI